MKCTKYPDREAAGFCAYSGKPYCKEELVEIYGKMVAKDNLEKFMEEQKKLAEGSAKKDSPMVFMNAGGGGASSSSSSSSAASSSSGGVGIFADASCLDWILVFATGGLWLIWMIIRPRRIV